MLAPKAFFSFTEVPDPANHQAYNEWHQLDHRPENLALPGVAWGERWVRSPDCAAVAVGEPDYTAAQYVNVYWFGDPVAGPEQWTELAHRSLHAGRLDNVRLTRSPFMGFVMPVQGYVNTRVRVSADVLPYRPNRGVHIALTRIETDSRDQIEDLAKWYDRVRVPQLLELPGAAGAWTFSVERSFRSALDDPTADTPPPLRVVLVYLDGDPVTFAEALAKTPPDRDLDIETTLYASPLRAIAPWQWDWFD